MKALKVGLHRYTIHFERSAAVAAHTDNRGSTDKETGSIVIDGTMPASRQRETTLHEVLHVAWDQSALRVHDVQDHEELVVTALAGPLLEALRRNPQLVKFLLR